MKINCLQKKPFYIFEIESFLNDDEYDLIERNFPLEDKKQMLNAIGNKTYFDNQIKGNALYEDLALKNNEAIKTLSKKFDEVFFIDLIKKLKKEIFIARLSNIKDLRTLFLLLRKSKIVEKITQKNIFQKFLYSNYRRFFEFSYMHKDSFFLPHTDKITKLISLMLYFPSKEIENLNIGTTFYKSRFKNFDNEQPFSSIEENSAFYEKNLHEIFTLPFKKKSLYGFIKSDVSWHGVKKLEIPENETRRSININLKF